MRAFAAEFSDSCGLCDRPVGEGDLIVIVDDEVCHAQCAEDDGEAVEFPDE